MHDFAQREAKNEGNNLPCWREGWMDGKVQISGMQSPIKIVTVAVVVDAKKLCKTVWI